MDPSAKTKEQAVTVPVEGSIVPELKSGALGKQEWQYWCCQVPLG